MSTREERLRAIDAAVFRAITSADWAVALRRARGAGESGPGAGARGVCRRA